MPQNSGNESDSPQMDEVLAEFIRRRDAGEPVDVESLCAARPDLADALRSYADGEALLREMALDDSVPAGSAVAETMRPGAMRETDSLIAGRTLGNYRLIRQLGQGAMGAVYLAEDTTLQRQAAVKVPKFSPADGSDARERFFREARAAAALNHPQICPVFHADEVHGTLFIAMAFINGQPLSRFVGTADFQDQRRIAEVLRLVADGLQHAHERGIIHRDLKPGNIMLDQQGQPVVTDFGLARRLVQEQESRITQEGQILGTPAYMSPEQITGNLDKLTSATDIYALGVVLFELLTGRLPFQGNAPAVIAAALHTQPPKPSSLRADVDPELEALCLQMLRKEAAQRPKSMREVSDRLAKWLAKPAPPSAAEQAAAKLLRAELEAEQHKIKQSIRSGQFQAALKQLQGLARRKEPAAGEFRQWAAEQIPRVKALPAKMKRDEPEMVRMAQDWVSRYDYEQAIQILRGIPDLCRSEEAEELLQKAVELQQEADELLLDLKKCVQQKQFDGIDDNVRRLLELKPGNQFAKNLWEKLHSYRGVPAGSRRYRFDSKGRLLPLNDGGDWTRNLILAGLTGLLVFGLMTWGIVIYLRNDDQTLAVEVDDAWLKEQNGRLSLSVDGKDHTITGPGFDIKIALGDRGFSVKNGDAIVHNPQTFTIEKEGRQVLRIDGSGMNLVGWASPTNDPSPTLQADGGQSPPYATPVVIDAPLTPLPDGPPGFVKTLDGHTGIITGLAFAPDGRTLVSVSATDGMLRIWDIESGETRHAIKAGIGYGTAIHPDGKSILVSISDYVENHPILYDINTGGVLAKFPGLGGPVFSCAFSPNGKYAALEADKYGVKVYDVTDLATQSLVAEFPGGSSGPASAIEFLPDNEHVIESTYSGTRLFHVPSKREIRRYLSDGKSSGTTSLTMAVRPDGKHFFIRNSVTWEVVGYDVAQDTPVERFANVRDLPRYSPDGLHLICFQDHDPKKGTPLALTVRSPKSGATVWQASLTEQTQPLGMKLSAVSPDGRYVVLGGMSDISQNGSATIKGIPNPLYLWRLPKEVWPKLKTEASSQTKIAAIDSSLAPLPDGHPGLLKIQLSPASGAAQAAPVPFPADARFVNARKIAELNAQTTSAAVANAFPWISPDGLTIWWTREGQEFDAEGIYEARRPLSDRSFTGIRQVLPHARLATVSSDGLEIVTTFDADGDGKKNELGSSRRGSVDATFPPLTRIPQFDQIENPKGTALSADGRRLFVLASRLLTRGENDVFVLSRTSPTSPWQHPRTVGITGGLPVRSWTWPSLTTDGKHLLLGYFRENASDEWPAVADATVDQDRFTNSRPILIDGQTINTRANRYCPATGELFFTRPQGAETPPYKGWELWVANAPSVK